MSDPITSKEFLASIGQKVSGTNNELQNRVTLYSKHAQLLNRYRRKYDTLKKDKGIFNRKLPVDEVNSISGVWVVGCYPPLTERQLYTYIQSKRSAIVAGQKSMLQKGYSLFKSQKVRLILFL